MCLLWRSTLKLPGRHDTQHVLINFVSITNLAIEMQSDTTIPTVNNGCTQTGVLIQGVLCYRRTFE